MRLNSLTKLFLAIIALAFVTSVFAGPMPMEKNVAPVQPSCDWTGFYIGVNAGVAQIESHFIDEWGVSGDGLPGSTDYSSSAGFIGGGQIGYNYQWQDLVFGIEADFSGLAGADSSSTRYDCGSYCSPGEAPEEAAEGNEYWSTHAKIDFMMTLRGRMGISFNNNRALVYVTAGGAYAHGDWNAYWHYRDGTAPTDYYSEYFSGDDWRWGWVGGVGIEYMINCHWSIRGEALYTWFGSDSEGIDYSRSGYYPNTEPYVARERFEDDLYTYRVGLNYRFTGFLGAH
jgi:outer membrane immunogenic protein